MAGVRETGLTCCGLVISSPNLVGMSLCPSLSPLNQECGKSPRVWDGMGWACSPGLRAGWVAALQPNLGEAVPMEGPSPWGCPGLPAPAQ